MTATTFGVVAALGIVVIQWLSSGLGGYLTGRLRTKWAGTHTHEIFFRDTAHGFIAWAVATIIGAVVLASATSSMVGGGVRATAAVAAGAAQGAASGAAAGLSDARAYDIDGLFRSDRPDAGAMNPDTRLEAARILAHGMPGGEVSAPDRTYLAQLVAARTGASPADAQKRVDDVIAQEKIAETQVRQAADTARKAASTLSFFTALSMLIGAFIACAAAALGGQQRDEHA